MSAKWVRSRQWDEAFFPRWAWPAKLVLRAFSSIGLAVLLLSLVAIYGVLASVPLGMLAGIPTWLVYLATLAAVVGVVAVMPTAFTMRSMARAGRLGAPVRFALGFGMLLATGALAWTLWYALLWPHLRYDTSGAVPAGFKLFPAFCEEYKRTMLRHLPGVEMSEMEFYSWWPLRLVLLAFVVNLATATIRRIEFRFMNLGVLTVHTGIITIAIGSVYYGALKQEGDVFLFAGRPDPQSQSGAPAVGQPARGFFLNPEQADPALWIMQPARGEGWESRSITRLPRYNDYGLDAAGPTIAGESRRQADRGRDLAIGLEPPAIPGAGSRIDADLQFRVVGYAAYGETRDTWVDGAGMGGSTVLRRVELLGPASRTAGAPADLVPVGELLLAPGVPADQAVTLGGFADVEYTEGLPAQRLQELQAALPERARHGLVIHLPGAPGPVIVAAEPGSTHDLPGGWSVLVKELHPTPPISIITPGYEGATSPVAILRIQPPKGADGTPPPAFDRYVYARFPDLNQDLLDEQQASGMPKRRAADDSIRIAYIDASRVTVLIDGGAGPARVILRVPGAPMRTIENVKEGEEVRLAPMFAIRLGRRLAAAEKIDAPWPVPDESRDRDLLRTRRASQIAVEVSTARDGQVTWSTVLWLPHNAWHPVQTDDDLQRVVALPDGRSIVLAYGRRYQPFPGFQIALRDFEMTPYPHTMTPKDYRSDLLVTRVVPGAGVTEETHSTSMNNPLLLRVPYQRNPEAPAITSAASWLVSWIAPSQYKLSQNSWDPAGWNQSKALTDAGELPRPYARFTIIGVGNNPGIYIIATGGVLMALGIPWAFYVKPWLLRREKRRIQSTLAARAANAPAGPGPALETNGSHAQARPRVASGRSES